MLATIILGTATHIHPPLTQPLSQKPIFKVATLSSLFTSPFVTVQQPTTSKPLVTVIHGTATLIPLPPILLPLLKPMLKAAIQSLHSYSRCFIVILALTTKQHATPSLGMATHILLLPTRLLSLRQIPTDVIL